jgi:type III secretion protein J
MHKPGSKKNIVFKLVKTLIISLLLGLTLSACESSSVVINNIDEREANEILVTLYTANISAEKVEAPGKEISWNISVPKSQKIASLAILTRRGFPRSKRDSVLQIINRSSGLVPSDTTEELKFREGKARQIENTILKMDGIIDASVEISYPQSDPLNPGKEKASLTASVYIKLEGPLDPNNQLVSRVKRLVSSSISGLGFEDVTVITDQTRLSDYSKMTKANAATLNSGAGLVKIWSITMTKESQSTFQRIFFGFLAINLLFLFLFSFLFWKFFFLVKDAPKGFRILANPKPLKSEDFQAPESAATQTSKDEDDEVDDEENEDDEEDDDEEDDDEEDDDDYLDDEDLDNENEETKPSQ